METATINASSTLLQLHDSFIQTAQHLLNREELRENDIKTIIPKLFLTTTLEITAKKENAPKLDRLITFFKKSYLSNPTAESFIRINTLYSEVMSECPSKETLKKLLELEKNLNLLGGYILQKQNSVLHSLFKPRITLEHYKVHFSQEIYGKGLNNMGNICWLNSVVQYLTHTPLYDPIIRQDLSFRRQLVQLIEGLRNRQNNAEIRTLQSSLIQAIKDDEEFSGLSIGQQQDADEFLSKIILSAENLPQEMRIEGMKIYEGVDPNCVRLSAELPPAVRFQVKPAVAMEQLNLDKLFRIKEEVSLKGYYQRSSDGQITYNEDEESLFQMYEVHTYLPEIIEVVIPRTTDFGNQEVIHTEIALNDNQLLLTQYEPLSRMMNGQKAIIGAKPKYNCYYTPIASVMHCGDSGKRGHYIAYADKDLSIVQYDDNNIKGGFSSPVWKGAYILQLRLDRREEVPEEFFKSFFTL